MEAEEEEQKESTSGGKERQAKEERSEMEIRKNGRREGKQGGMLSHAV